MIEMSLSFTSILIGMPSAFTPTTVVGDEKKEKVFEQIFITPLSPLKLVLFHFIALIPLMTLSIAIGYLIVISGMIISLGNVHLLYVLRGFVLSFIFALPLCYVLFLNLMLLPTKYSSLLPLFFLILPFLSMQSLYGMFSTTIGFSWLITLSIIITSTVLTTIGIIETAILKNRIVELTIISQ
ncbi:MAG: hypothetical protein RMI79_00685 [Nitrososphaerota archaeon]|nr:hypothetical protein [Nitrososphaerota archaeon]